MSLSKLKEEVIELLKKLIAIQSFSKEEDKTARLIHQFLSAHQVEVNLDLNNVWGRNMYFDSEKPTIILNSHHDTVRPNSQWKRDPFTATVEDNILYGLGSNDAGGALVSLLATFLHFYQQPDLNYNLIYAATAEEEISGSNGLEHLLPSLGKLDLGIVGEPTGMDMAVSEKGLVVLDCLVHGKAGHAARSTGTNAITKALKDLEWFDTYEFKLQSKYLGPVKMTITVINAGSQHNVIPEICEFTVDVRTTDQYSNQEVVDLIRHHVSCEVTPRSLRLNPSGIPEDHPVVVAGEKTGSMLFGSPTSSDQALIKFPSVKIGPGLSERSHTADEHINLDEIRLGIDRYIKILDQLLTPKTTIHETVAKRL